MYPLVKGALSLVASTHQITRTQADIDDGVGALISAMNTGSELAKKYAPLNGRYSPDDVMFRDMLKEIVKGANIVKVYCKKRPSST